MSIDYRLIGERIKAERKKRGLTQENLAEKLDVSIGYVSQVERGITKISLDLLAEISAILKCDIASLIVGSAVNSENYIKSDILTEISALDPQKRKLLFEFIKILSKS
ncbi:MAG: helix-turn-helix transcriptional regulator [Clostridia bacterium]|nr:helix-turn-helix transcriptional regulator [Clostridia bacterium]